MNMTLEIFSRLLLTVNIAPAEDFYSSSELCYISAPGHALRARICFILKQQTSANSSSNQQLQSPPISFKLVEEEELKRLIKFWRAKLAPDLEETESTNDFDQDDLNDLSTDAPVIRLVNHLFDRALDLNASDIHFEPEENSFDVRCRVDGIMTQIETLPISAQPPVISRLKLMAKLDIGEKRLPQDGRISYKMGSKNLDLRVSTLPGVHGESVVLRILDRSDVMVSLEALGMPFNLLERYKKLIHQPHGMILITGPTGSGKTTTLYATLEKISSKKQKIITVEDPVEYQLEGITQIHVNTKIGLDFSSGLRSIVRQDPDIIMIGEIRDHETASIAIESALTGHLVFSTLHTNDAAGAITRMQDMGVESYLISSSLLAVQAQRLVRQVCEHCKEEAKITAIEVKLLDLKNSDIHTIYHGKGCQRCGNTGYQGRIGLYELLVLSEPVRNLINAGADASTLRQQAIKEGMQTLRQDALEKLAKGLTTPEEVVRVTRSI
ncbi:MAG: GspE/PulE family protein [Pseudomonadota bacterium]